jgi:hypothetical protein
MRMAENDPAGRCGVTKKRPSWATCRHQRSRLFLTLLRIRERLLQGDESDHYHLPSALESGVSTGRLLGAATVLEIVSKTMSRMTLRRSRLQ